LQFDSEIRILSGKLSVILEKYEVLTIVIMKIVVFWDITLCNLIEYSNVLEEPAASISRVDGGRRFL
jgi:hypothetical protein